jgi:small-conductance mechanosensitive channel
MFLNYIRDWYNNVDSAEGLLWSGVAVITAGVAYLLLRRRIHGPHSRSESIVIRRRLLMMGLGLIVLVTLTRIWLQAPYGSVSTFEPGRNVMEGLLWTVIVGVVIYILVKMLQGTLLRSETEIETRHRIRQVASWMGVLAFLVAMMFIWASQIGDLGVFLGIIGAGLALSMGETLLCIAGWLILIIRRPYDIGDRVEIDGRIGDVIGFSMFHTSMLEIGNWVKADQGTGRMLIIPNSMILRNAVYNYTKGFPFVWNEFSTIVTFESNWEAAKAIMMQEAEEEAEKIETEVRRHIQKMQSRYAIRYTHLRPIVYTSIAEVGVCLTLRYLSPVRQRRSTTHRISEDILREFIHARDIDFAYPTTRFFNNLTEGKPLAGGPQTPGDQPGEN